MSNTKNRYSVFPSVFPSLCSRFILLDHFEELSKDKNSRNKNERHLNKQHLLTTWVDLLYNTSVKLFILPPCSNAATEIYLFLCHPIWYYSAEHVVIYVYSLYFFGCFLLLICWKSIVWYKILNLWYPISHWVLETQCSDISSQMCKFVIKPGSNLKKCV